MKTRENVWASAVLMVLLAGALAANAATSSSSATSTAVSPTNMVVDFSASSFDSNVRPGDTAIINLVIKNSGGRNADNVQVWLQSTSTVRTDKRFFVGQMDPGETKTLPVIFTVDPNSKTGLSAIQVKINYDGYDYDGTLNNNQLTSWEIPLNVLGNPLFQISPQKTSYFMDSMDELNLGGISRDSVKDVEATLSSSCATIIGSSRQYVGIVSPTQPFNLTFMIKPSAPGACLSYLRLAYADESGNKASDNVTIGLNIQDEGVDFKVTNMSYTPTGPGEQTVLSIHLKNVGSSDAEDVTLNLNVSSPFVPVGTSELYIPSIKAGEDVKVDFAVAVTWSADTTAYSIPLNIAYKVGGTSYGTSKNLGIDVSGTVILEVINVQQSGSSVRIDVANIGTRTADGVKATLISSVPASSLAGSTTRRRTSANDTTAGNAASGDTGTSGTQEQRLVSYKSDIKANKQTTFTFATSVTGPATLEIEYTGRNNERIKQTEKVTLSSGSSSGTRGASTTSSGYMNYLYVAVALVIVYLGYRRYKGNKK